MGRAPAPLNWRLKRCRRWGKWSPFQLVCAGHMHTCGRDHNTTLIGHGRGREFSFSQPPEGLPYMAGWFVNSPRRFAGQVCCSNTVAGFLELLGRMAVSEATISPRHAPRPCTHLPGERPLLLMIMPRHHCVRACTQHSHSRTSQSGHTDSRIVEVGLKTTHCCDHT